MPINLYPDELTMTNEQLKKLFQEVQEKMVEHVSPSLTEVYYPNASNPSFMENGTGAFVEVAGRKFLISNEHVTNNNGLHYSFFEFDRFIFAAAQRLSLSAPVDIGASEVVEHVWARYAAKASAIPFERFANIHDTVRHEILWMGGYPGARVKQFEELTLSVCQALPTQEYLFLDGEKPHSEFDHEYHFAVAYSPGKAQPFDISTPSNSPGLSDPHGLSGSLVWNTRRLEFFYKNKPWNPSMAVVTGIVWGWPNSEYLIATKVEHIRAFLRRVSGKFLHPLS